MAILCWAAKNSLRGTLGYKLTWTGLDHSHEPIVGFHDYEHKISQLLRHFCVWLYPHFLPACIGRLLPDAKEKEDKERKKDGGHGP